MLGLVAARVVLALVAIPLAPFLYRKHAVVLVLLRPTKDVLLLMGFLLRKGDVALPPVVAAAIPLLVFGVWLFFFLGKAYAKEINNADLPGIAGRLLPADRIGKLSESVSDQGLKLVFLGRLAAFPSTLVAAAAGASELPTGRFLLADGLGALVSIVEIVGAGYLLGGAYERAGPWLTIVGLLVLVLMVFVLGRNLRTKGGPSTGMLRRIRRTRKQKGVRAAVEEARGQLLSKGT